MSPFELRYVPQPEPSEDEKEIAEDDLTTAFYSEGSLDVTELLREQFQLALPTGPVPPVRGEFEPHHL